MIYKISDYLFTGFKSVESIEKLLFKPNTSPFTHGPVVIALSSRVCVEFDGKQAAFIIFDG
jgi:hypothetical protein